LPTNANGKLDVKALPDPFEVTSAAVDEVADDDLGIVIAAWVSILGKRPRSNDTNFFDAGGTSLEAVKLHETLCKDLNRGLSYTFVFENPTIQHQFEALSASTGLEDGAMDRGVRRRAAGSRRARARS